VNLNFYHEKQLQAGDCQSYVEWSIKVLIEDSNGRIDENKDATVISIKKITLIKR